MRETIKNAIRFVLVLLPFIAIGGFFTGRYVFASYDADMQELLLAQIGSVNTFGVITMIQSVMYAVVCGLLGFILADKTGLLKSFAFKKDILIKAIVTAVACGVFFSMDYWMFGALIPQVAQSYASGLLIRNVDNWISSVLYGGIVEELLLRFFMMTLIVLIIWKMCYRKYKKENIPGKVFVIANVISAMLFAAGHLPTTYVVFGEVTALILFRCFFLNGLFGVVFGELYRRYGIQYAIVGHMGTHIVSKLIWLVLL